MAGAEDLNIGGSTFATDLPDGTVANFHSIGSHTFLDTLRNALQNGCAGTGSTDDRAALNTLANTTLQPNGGSIYFPAGTTYAIGSNMTFPSNVNLIFGPGAVLAVPFGVTVTINGPITAVSATISSGSGTVAYGGSAQKAVLGPTSATDNAFARFDAASGALLQNSAVIADDAGNVSALSVTATQKLESLNGMVFFSGNSSSDVLLRNSGNQLLCRLGNDGDYAGLLAQFLVAVDGMVYYGPADVSHTALVGVGTTLFCKLGDNSAYATFDAGAYKVGGVAGVDYSAGGLVFNKGILTAHP